MRRQEFLKSIAFSSAAFWWDLPDSKTPRKPPMLKAGDLVAICSPAGYISLEDIQPAIQQITSWGLQVVIGDSIGKRDFTFGGTDEERAADLQHWLDHHQVKAILCARGGYGMVRIIDQLHFKGFLKHPKWVIGFSDITVFHAHIQSKFGMPTIHSKMCNSFPKDWSLAEPIQVETILSIKQALMGPPLQYAIPAHPENKCGKATGKLVGGNLRTLETLAGTASDLETKGNILFVEDTGEYLYSIDRMFWNLKRSGKLHRLKGLLIGGFKVKPEEADEPFGKTLQQIVLEKVKEYNYPVCFDFPVGHQKNNFALKCGIKHQLVVNADGVTLKEI